VALDTTQPGGVTLAAQEQHWLGEDGQEHRAWQDPTIGTSVAAMLLGRAASHGGATILRKKDRGIWKGVTWSGLAAEARRIGMGLKALGFAPGDVAAVLADTSPEWVYADLGILGAGGISAGIYPTDAPSQVAYLLENCGARVLFVENEEQLDKALEAKARCPALMRIVIFDMTGLRDLDDPICESLAMFVERGEAQDRAHPGDWEAGIAAIEPEKTAILVYTSGTTGPPKGAMLSHRNILFQIVNATRLLDQREGDERVAFLPMCHVAERIAGLYQSLYAGTVSNYVEGPETLLENLREAQPTVMGAVPRVWERFYSRVQIEVQEATWVQRKLYQWAIGVGHRVADAQLAGGEASGFTRLEHALAGRLILGNVRRDIGLDRVRWAFVGAAPTSPELIRWYLALGVRLLEVYGQTENGGIATAMPADAMRLRSVGRPVPYGELKLSPEGEILLRGEHVFQGYWNDPVKTAETIRDGWLHTGDVGEIKDGYLRVTDRMKDIIITSGGKNITPSELENELKFSNFITDAIVIGDKRKYLCCLIMIDHENVEKWAQDNNVPFSNFSSLTRADAVLGLIQTELDRVNAKFARVEQIKNFRLIEHKLEAEDPELTPTMKLKRRFVHDKYSMLIETMYEEA
jgi:long-chain acyl-CoA synthetase